MPNPVYLNWLIKTSGSDWVMWVFQGRPWSMPLIINCIRWLIAGTNDNYMSCLSETRLLTKGVGKKIVAGCGKHVFTSSNSTSIFWRRCRDRLQTCDHTDLHSFSRKALHIFARYNSRPVSDMVIDILHLRISIMYLVRPPSPPPPPPPKKNCLSWALSSISPGTTTIPRRN